MIQTQLLGAIWDELWVWDELIMGLGTSSPPSAAGTAGPASLAQSWAACI